MPTKSYRREEVIVRHPENPILQAGDIPYEANAIFNPAATLMPDGSTLLLCRVEDMRGHSHLTIARSADGISGWEVDAGPALAPDIHNHPEELWGVEDPRITYVPELNKYAVLYTSYSRSGPGVSLALTEDFKTFERLGVVMPPEDKDAALLPHRINGLWALIHRPVGSMGMGANMWVSYSEDLHHWGDHKLMLEARRGAWWDANKIGLCMPPIETPRGWLVMYHGVRTTCAGCIYRLGLALFDKESPDVCLVRGDPWIFGPQEDYERFGDVANVVFPCGYTLGSDGDTLNIYYGAADTSVGLATTSVQKLMGWLDKHGREYARRLPSGISVNDAYRDQERRT